MQRLPRTTHDVPDRVPQSTYYQAELPCAEYQYSFQVTYFRKSAVPVAGAGGSGCSSTTSAASQRATTSHRLCDRDNLTSVKAKAYSGQSVLLLLRV